jgi:hypothetical protein
MEQYSKIKPWEMGFRPSSPNLFTGSQLPFVSTHLLESYS